MLFLADTSIWIDHFRHTNVKLSNLLGRCNILLHPFVLDELALGHVRNLSGMIDGFRDLPQAPVAHADEVLQLIARDRLFGSGIGYVDAHMLASASHAGCSPVDSRQEAADRGRKTRDLRSDAGLRP